MNNQLQKKNSLLKEIYDAYEDIIIAILGIFISVLLVISIIFIPYLLGRLLYIVPFTGSLLHSIELKSRYGGFDCFGFWLVGGLPVIIIFLLIYATKILICAINMLKRTACLPTTKKELKALNINTFDELDTFMLDFFGTNDISSEFIFEHLVRKLTYCFALLPLPEAATYLESYEEHKDYKNKYIDLRSRVLAGKIFEQDHRTWFIKTKQDIQDYESAEIKKKFAEEAAITYIWTPGEPCPCCGEDPYKGLNADIYEDWQPRYCPNCGNKIKKDIGDKHDE